jgi:peptidoglycan-associated lipoprotein
MRRLVIAWLAIAAAGCPKPQYPECKSDQDCASHTEVCINGFCKQCRDDSNCAAVPGKPLCRDNICVAKAECARNEDCGPGRKCAQNKCVAECASDADCAQGQTCMGGACRTMPRPAAGAASECNLRPVHFDFDDSTLTSDARRTLDDEFQCLRDKQYRRLVLAGHCDERGTREYNLALGERRAESVRRYLSQLGIAGEKLATISYGAERPADPGHDEAAWAKNRRVEITPEP